MICPLQNLHNRKTVIETVREDWIEGVLNKSLDGVVWLDLGFEKRPDAVARLRNVVIKVGDQTPEPLAHDIGKVLADSRGALLSLGAPGAGKTTPLLELASDLLQRAAADTTRPIPIVFNLSSWTPRRGTSSNGWLTN